MMTDKKEALNRLRELLIKRNECVGEAYRIDEYVQSLMEQAKQADQDQVSDIAREIDRNRVRIEAINREVEHARSQLVEEIQEIIEILGEEIVLDELAKHPVEPVVVSLH